MATKHHHTSSAEQGKACAVLSYLLVGIIWYFADENMRKNDFAKFHAKQGLVFLIAAIIYDIALGIVLGAILFPLLFRGLAFGLYGILSLLYYVPLIFFIIGIVNAVNNNKKELPIIGKYAKVFKF